MISNFGCRMSQHAPSAGRSAFSPTASSNVSNSKLSVRLVATVALALPGLALPLVASSLLFAPSAIAAQDANRDVVNLKNGTSELGKVKSEDFAGVELDPVKGDAKVIPWAEIAPNGIAYADPEWQAIADMLAVSRYAEAIPALEELKGDAKRRAPIRQNVLYFHAVALQRTGKTDEALAAFKELVTAYPKSRYLMETGEAMSSILAGKKDFAGATKALNDLEAAAGDSSFSAAAGVLKGRLFEDQKDWAKAGGAYTVAANSKDVPPAVQMQAELGLARTLAAQNKKGEAEAALRKLVAKDGPNSIMAGVWNGLAELAEEKARAANNGKGDVEQLVDTVFMYLRGVVQYAPIPGESTHEYERALAGAARTFRALGEVDTIADRKRRYQQLAAQRTEQLKREFPNSIFAK